MNFFTETLTVIVGIVVADTLLDSEKRSELAKAVQYVRGEAEIIKARIMSKAAR